MRSFAERVGVAAIVCLISIPSLPALVNAATRAAAGRLVAETMKAGTAFVITPRLGEHLGFDRETPVKVLEVAPESSPENTAHGCHVVMSSTGTAKPLSLILMVNRRPEGVSESHYFLLDLAGTPQRAFKSVTKLDSAGKVVRGSGVATPLDVSHPDVQALLDREVAFWLKRYHKSPKKQPAAPKR